MGDIVDFDSKRKGKPPISEGAAITTGDICLKFVRALRYVHKGDLIAVFEHEGNIYEVSVEIRPAPNIPPDFAG